MNITLVMVASINGKTTNGSDADIYSWTSAEDKKMFFSMIAQCSCVIMGRKTYLAAKNYITLSPKILRIVLTRHPQNYSKDNVPEKLEFTDMTPHELIPSLEKRGHTSALLVGGSEINALFLHASLIDEVMLTLEPKIIGSGTSLFSEFDGLVDVQLQHVEQLNPSGTLTLVYRTVYDTHQQ